MKLKTVFTAPFFSVDVTNEKPAGGSVDYAEAFAEAQGAHLTVAVAAMRMHAASAFFSDARAIIHAANRELEQQASTFAERTAAGFAAKGIAGEVDLVVEDFERLCARVIAGARAADLSVMRPEDSLLSLQQSLLETLLFESGRPVIVAPDGWQGSAAPERIMVSWDGSNKSARAVGDALPLLQQAEVVEIVSVSGDANATKRLEGTGIARHLSRHCKSVSVTQLSAPHGDIAKALGEHATMTKANMLIMGAYAHSRLRQLILGGVTDAMIHHPPLPVFMSY